MVKISKSLFKFPTIPLYAKKNFEELNKQADTVMLGILFLHWFIASFITAIRYDTFLYGFVGGALIVLPMAFVYKYLRGDKIYRNFMAIAIMLFSVIFIQQYLGQIEMHFHVFIAMAMLTLYKDIYPLLIAAVTTILHHIIFNYLQLYEVSLFDMPVMIFNYGCGMDIVILHAIFVVSEFIVLGYFIKLQIEHSVALNLNKNKVLELNKELKYKSHHDSLTGLPNRLYLNEKIDEIKQQSKENSKKFAIIFLDLDHFKNINDTLGHDVGDALLKKVAGILKNNIKNRNDLITRIGGDEFIIVVGNITSIDDLLPIINNLLIEFRKEMLIKGYSLRLSASIGISIYPDDSTSIRELMKYADIAMYKSKEHGRDNFSFFTQTLNNKIHNEVDIINDMQRALYEDEFKLYFQPKIDVQTKKVIGAEVLLRWIHHEKGLITPDIFIPLAESTGFILSLGQFVLQEGVKSIKRLNSLGYEDLRISVNVSTRQFQNTDVYSDLKKELDTYNVKPEQLGIEITETIMMQHVDKTLSTLKQIKKLGVLIYIDDFGTGYSSLSYLNKFPVDVLKVDKSFVDEIKEEGSNKDLLLNTVLAMGKSLNLGVVAEGVEKEYQYQYLKDKDCDIIQGFYFAKPMCEEDFIEFLKTF